MWDRLVLDMHRHPNSFVFTLQLIERLLAVSLKSKTSTVVIVIGRCARVAALWQPSSPSCRVQEAGASKSTAKTECVLWCMRAGD